MNYYLLFKLIHVTAVILFLGNVFTGLFWMHQAHTTKDLTIIHHTIKALIRSDQFFTIPGVIVITAAGVVSALQAHYPLLRTGWILWSIVLFSLSGVVFAWKLVPLQKKLKQITHISDNDALSFDWSHYAKLYRAWERWGLIAIVTPIAALVLMVLKWPTKALF
jgi:uncharacterized membrane protein